MNSIRSFRGKSLDNSIPNGVPLTYMFVSHVQEKKWIPATNSSNQYHITPHLCKATPPWFSSHWHCRIIIKGNGPLMQVIWHLECMYIIKMLCDIRYEADCVIMYGERGTASWACVYKDMFVCTPEPLHLACSSPIRTLAVTTLNKLKSGKQTVPFSMLAHP